MTVLALEVLPPAVAPARLEAHRKGLVEIAVATEMVHKGWLGVVQVGRKTAVEEVLQKDVLRGRWWAGNPAQEHIDSGRRVHSKAVRCMATALSEWAETSHSAQEPVKSHWTAAAHMHC